MALGRVICVAGPTASGKTALGARIARALGGEVISCDSMQLYRGMDIATAKPTEEEMLGVKHHMLDAAEPGEVYSVARYVAEATPIVDDILTRGKVPVIVGGTGLYMDSLVRGNSFAEAGGDTLRGRLETLYDRFGRERLWRLLNSRDPEAAAKIHQNDRKRLVRALEVAFSAGTAISEHNKKTSALDERYTALYIGLSYRDREKLYGRIDARCDKMLAQGLTEELYRLGDRLGGTAAQAIGYKELIAGGAQPTPEAVENWKRATRRYAKRQLTWFKRRPETLWFYRDEQTDEEIFEQVLKSAILFLYNEVV